MVSIIAKKMHSKRSLEHGRGKGFAKRQGKRLVVDQRQQSHIPKVKFLKIGGERGEIAPTNTSGLSTTHAIGKLTGEKVNARNRRKIVMRPPKPVRNAILVLKGKNGISQTIYFSKQDKQGPSFKPPKILDAAEEELLCQIVRSDDEGMNKMKKRCKRISRL